MAEATNIMKQPPSPSSLREELLEIRAFCVASCNTYAADQTESQRVMKPTSKMTEQSKGSQFRVAKTHMTNSICTEQSR